MTFWELVLGCFFKEFGGRAEPEANLNHALGPQGYCSL